jgi:hypothetical protein
MQYCFSFQYASLDAQLIFLNLTQQTLKYIPERVKRPFSYYYSMFTVPTGSPLPVTLPT